MRSPLSAIANLWLALLICEGSVSACPAHYVSQEALVRDARSIIEVEILSVSDAPQIKHGLGAHRDSHKGAQAKVQVLNTLKGECIPREFTVVGGPYASCSVFPEFLHFQKGERLHLILDMPVTAACHTVVITCAGRVTVSTAVELRDLMAKARVTWRDAVARHLRAAPEAMATAEKLLASTNGDFTQLNAASQSFDVLCCLRILLNDPDHRPVPNTPRSRTGGSLFAPGSSNASTEGTLITAQRDELFLPPPMEATLEQWAKEQADDVFNFNLAMITTLLRDELLVPESLLASLTTDAAARAHLSWSNNGPLWHSLPGTRDSASLVISSLSALLMMAAPEPDYLVFGMFGQQQSQSYLPEVFLAYLKREGDQLLQEKPQVAKVLLSVPHPDVAVLLKAHLRNGYGHAQSYFDFFASMSMVEELGEVLETYEKRVDADLAATKNLPKGPFSGDPAGYYLETIKKMQQTLQDRKLEAPAVSARLQAMKVKLSANTPRDGS